MALHTDNTDTELVDKTSLMNINPLECRGNYNAASNDTKLVNWVLMGGLLHLVQRGGAWVGPQPI